MDVAGAWLGLLLVIGLVFYFWPRKPWANRENSAEDYKRLFDGIPTPMYIYDDRTFRFLAVNDAALQQYGYTREEFFDLKLTDIRPRKRSPRCSNFMKACRKVM